MIKLEGQFKRLLKHINIKKGKEIIKLYSRAVSEVE